MTANNRSNSERREGLLEKGDALVRAEAFRQNASEKRGARVASNFVYVKRF